MRRSVLLFLLTALTHAVPAQELTGAARTDFLARTRALYYAPIRHGLSSFSCEVHIDWATVPQQLLPPSAVAQRQFLEKVPLHVDVTGVTPVFNSAIPSDSDPTLREQTLPTLGFLNRTVTGFIRFWAAHGIYGSIPLFR